MVCSTREIFAGSDVCHNFVELGRKAGRIIEGVQNVLDYVQVRLEQIRIEQGRTVAIFRASQKMRIDPRDQECFGILASVVDGDRERLAVFDLTYASLLSLQAKVKDKVQAALVDLSVDIAENLSSSVEFKHTDLKERIDRAMKFLSYLREEVLFSLMMAGIFVTQGRRLFLGDDFEVEERVMSKREHRDYNRGRMESLKASKREYAEGLVSV